MRPPYITATRSHMRAITPRSCVIRMMASPRLAWSEASKSRVCDWMVTSRAVVGSSAIRSSGSHASAMDHHPLAHASGDLVRILRHPALRGRDADKRKELDRAGARRSAGEIEMMTQDFADLRPDREQWV